MPTLTPRGPQDLAGKGAGRRCKEAGVPGTATKSREREKTPLQVPGYTCDPRGKRLEVTVGW